MIPHRRQAAAVLATSLVPYILLVVLHWSYLPVVSAGDYAQYLLHADALLHGREYGDIGYIFTSYNPLIGPRAQPPGLPLTLVPILAIGGFDTPLLKLLMVVSGAAFLLLAGWYFARRGELLGVAGAMILTGIALEAAYATSSILSDLGFAALVWAVILLVDREGEWTTRRIVLVTALGLAAMAYRIPGVTLVPALLCHALLQPATSRRRVLVPALIWAGVLGIGALVMSETAPFLDLLFAEPTVLARRLVQNVMRYRHAIFEAHLYPFTVDRANDIYHVIAAILTAAGLVLLARRHARSFFLTFSLVYGATLLVAPVAEPRYAWLLYPVLVLGLHHGIALFARRVARLEPVSSHRLALASVAVIGLLGSVSVISRPEPRSLLGEPDVKSLFARVIELREKEPVRISFANPRVLTLETRVPAMMLIGPPPDRFVEELRARSISHVVVGDLGLNPRLLARVQKAIAEHPEHFTEEYRNPSFRLYRFLPDPGEAGPPGRDAVSGR